MILNPDLVGKHRIRAGFHTQILRQSSSENCVKRVTSKSKRSFRELYKPHGSFKLLSRVCNIFFFLRELMGFFSWQRLGVRLKATYHFEAYCCPLKCVVFSVVFPQTYDEVEIADDRFGLINPCLDHRW